MSYHCIFSTNKKLKLEILVDDEVNFSVPRKLIQKALTFQQEYFEKELKIKDYLNAASRFVSKESMKLLNKEYRKMENKVSNVLSFPVFNIKSVDDFKSYLLKYKDEDYYGIGDIMICPEFVKNECIETEEKVEERLVFLLIHSLLHLIGIHHNSEQNCKEMEKIEDLMMKKIIQSLN